MFKKILFFSLFTVSACGVDNDNSQEASGPHQSSADVIIVLPPVVTPTPVPTPTPPPIIINLPHDDDECKKGNWKKLTDDKGALFKSQDECKDFADKRRHHGHHGRRHDRDHHGRDRDGRDCR